MPPRLVILNDASVARGGATGLALLSARLMRARGLQVVLFCGDEGANPDLAEAGIEVIAAGGARLLDQSVAKSLTTGFWNRAARDRLAAFIARTDTPETVYHLHGWAQILSPSVFAALQPVANRTLVHAHDFFLACPNGVFTDYRKDEPCRRRPLGPSCLTTNCDKRSPIHKLWRSARTAALRRSFDQKLGWGGIALLHPDMAPLLALAGLDTARMEAHRNPAAAFSATRVRAEENHRLFFVGRVEIDKGIREVIAAARKAGMGLTVVGDGPERADLERQHPDVRFVGWKTREEIGDLIQDARGLAVATRHTEPFGLVVAEALQSGLPVILPETAILAREVAEKGLGLLCDMRRPETLPRAVERLRDMPAADLRAMSERAAAPENALASTPDGWADGLLAAYARLLAKASG